MKRILIFLALILNTTMFVYAQEYDFVLPPESSVPLYPSSYETQQGNWANAYLDIEKVDFTKADRQVYIFLYDTAEKLKHKNLQYGIRNDLARNFTNDFSEYDAHGHGTHCAGIIAGYDENIPLGVARDQAKMQKLSIIPYRVLESNGGGRYEWIDTGMDIGIKVGKRLQESEGAFIIHSLSLGGSVDYAPVNETIQKARAAGQLVIVASGNEGSSKVGFPARVPGAWAVGALEQFGDNVELAPYSNYGAQQFICAPGSDVLSTYPGDQLVNLSGTSMATPVVAGATAIVASTSTATANQIERYFADKSKDLGQVGRDNFYGYGAPVFNYLLQGDPLDYPDTPLNEEVPEDDTPPTRETRKLVFELKDYPTIWKRIGDNELNNLYLDLTVEMKTNLYDADAAELLYQLTGDFFTNRGFGLTEKMGFADATYWAKFFYEMILQKENDIEIKVIQIQGENDLGQTATYNRVFAEMMKAKIKNTLKTNAVAIQWQK